MRLEQLQLKPRALDLLSLPITVARGCIGAIDLTFNWAKLGSEPIQVKVRDVLLCVEPSEWDEHSHAEQVRIQKLIQIGAFERFRRTSEEEEAEEDRESEELSGMERMVQRAVDNMNLEISNVHICYEDFRRLNKSPFSAGVILESCTSFATDADGTRGFQDDPVHAYRSLEVTGVCAYGDCGVDKCRPVDRTSHEARIAVTSPFSLSML